MPAKDSGAIRIPSQGVMLYCSNCDKDHELIDVNFFFYNYRKPVCKIIRQSREWREHNNKAQTESRNKKISIMTEEELVEYKKQTNIKKRKSYHSPTSFTKEKRRLKRAEAKTYTAPEIPKPIKIVKKRKPKGPMIPTEGVMTFCDFCQIDHELTKEFFYFRSKKAPSCKLKEASKTPEQVLARKAYDKAKGIRDKDKKQEYNKKYYVENQEELRKYTKEYQIANPDKVRKWNKDRDGDPIRSRRHREQSYRAKKYKLATDPVFKLIDLTRDRISKAITKTCPTGKLDPVIGCSPKFLKEHIESQFEDWMTWDNHGLKTWHVDHRAPISHFDITDRDQLRIAFNWKNHQPLHYKKNLIKSDSVEQWQLDLIEEIKNDLGIK